MHRVAAFIALLCLPVAPAAAAEHPALAKARALYNAGDFDAAIESAQLSRGLPEWVHPSALVIARSHLERYRLRTDPSDLTQAREALTTVESGMLTSRDQVDLLIGLGQSLFFGELFGSAAELFDTALGRAAMLADGDRRQLLDWWASAVDRDAQVRPVHLRMEAYERLSARMEHELQQDPGCAPANYWLAVSARGTGDVDRAWNAAVAGWVRAFLRRETADGLRADLDRLVTDALIPERARARPPGEQADAASALAAEWDLVKQQWP